MFARAAEAAPEQRCTVKSNLPFFAADSGRIPQIPAFPPRAPGARANNKLKGSSP
jgi:hypothetical protein